MFVSNTILSPERVSKDARLYALASVTNFATSTRTSPLVIALVNVLISPDIKSYLETESEL